MLALLDQTEAIVANTAEAAIAREAVHRLQGVAKAGQDVKIFLEDPKILIPLPARAVEIIVRILSTMAEQRPFSVIPHEAEFTTQQAADFLNVSRPYLTGLIDADLIPARLVGRHRRIRFADLLEYEGKTRAARKQALAEMAAETERLRLE